MDLTGFSQVSLVALVFFGFKASALTCERVVTRGVQLVGTQAVIDFASGRLALEGPAGHLSILSAETVNPYDRVAVDFDRAQECQDSSSGRADGAQRFEVQCVADGGLTHARMKISVAHNRKTAEYHGRVSAAGYEDFDFDADFSNCHE